jgi:hypothetical protein
MEYNERKLIAEKLVRSGKKTWGGCHEVRTFRNKSRIWTLQTMAEPVLIHGTKIWTLAKKRTKQDTGCFTAHLPYFGE